jgi:GxxExxY protein
MKGKDLLTERIIGCCFNVHSELGPGFKERIYHNAMELALKKEKLTYKRENAYKVSYQNVPVGNFKADLVVQDKVIVELKSLAGNIPRIFESQIISYLKASELKVGLLVNFGNHSCQIRRFTN